MQTPTTSPPQSAETELTEAKAKDILVAAFLYLVHLGAAGPNLPLNEQMIAFGRRTLPDGDNEQLINEATHLLFGDYVFSVSKTFACGHG